MRHAVVTKVDLADIKTSSLCKLKFNTFLIKRMGQKSLLT